jgi:hypothetical protein
VEKARANVEPHKQLTVSNIIVSLPSSSRGTSDICVLDVAMVLSVPAALAPRATAAEAAAIGDEPVVVDALSTAGAAEA